MFAFCSPMLVELWGTAAAGRIARSPTTSDSQMNASLGLP